MRVTLRQTGVPSADQVEGAYPSPRLREKGPVAVFECFDPIPCDPCYASCPSGAVREFRDINDLPQLDQEKCTGCGICVARCPGLAVFVVQERYDGCRGLVKLPHEFLPLPEPGQTVDALDRSGRVLGPAEVVRVVGARRGDTPVVWIALDRGLVRDARCIRLKGDPPR